MMSVHVLQTLHFLSSPHGDGQGPLNGSLPAQSSTGSAADLRLRVRRRSFRLRTVGSGAAVVVVGSVLGDLLRRVRRLSVRLRLLGSGAGVVVGSGVVVGLLRRRRVRRLSVGAG